MSDPVTHSKTGGAQDVEVEKAYSQEEQQEHAYDLDEKAKTSDFKADAIEAENAEHNMGVIEAVKAYPMATFWAFVMSCTIVGCLSSFAIRSLEEETQLRICLIFRLWNPTMSSLWAISSPYLSSKKNMEFLMATTGSLRRSGSRHSKCLVR